MDVHDVFYSITVVLCVVWAITNQVNTGVPCYLEVESSYETCPKPKYQKPNISPTFWKLYYITSLLWKSYISVSLH